MVTHNQYICFLFFKFYQETRRRQLAEAAEKRQKENEARGVKDPDALKRKQKRKEELERQEASRPVNEDGPLKVDEGDTVLFNIL